MKIKKLSSMILTLSILVGSTQIEARNSFRSIAKRIAKYALTGAKGVGAGLHGLMTSVCLFGTVSFAIVAVKLAMPEMQREIQRILLQQDPRLTPELVQRVTFYCPMIAAIIAAGFTFSTVAHGYATHKCMQSFLDDLTGEEETSEEGKST